MKKKIFLNGRFLTQHITGVQRTAYELVKALDELIEEYVIDRERYNFILISPINVVTTIKLKHITVLQKGFLKGNLWEQLELPFYCFGHLLVSMGFISPLCKKKQMVIVHDAGTFSNPEFYKPLFRNWYQTAIRLLCKTSVKIITVSNYSKQELVKFTRTKQEHIAVIYNAADHILRFEEADALFKEKIDKLQPFVLGVSSLHPHKNFEMLAEAILQADMGAYNVLIAGGNHAKSFDKVSLNNSITELGYITNEQLKYLYSKASLFVFPSLFEGFGIPPLEAMISGCPVLASNATAIPEILGDACEYFDPLNRQQLVSKLNELLKDKTKQKLLQKKGYQQSALYSWKKSALDLFKLINRHD